MIAETLAIVNCIDYYQINNFLIIFLYFFKKKVINHTVFLINFNNYVEYKQLLIIV